MSDIIPEELLEILQAARDGKWGGRIELHLNDQGEIQNIVPSRVIRVRKKAPQGVGPICPRDGCGTKMIGSDYGNLWTCPREGCNTKRTRTQLARAEVALKNS